MNWYTPFKKIASFVLGNKAKALTLKQLPSEFPIGTRVLSYKISSHHPIHLILLGIGEIVAGNGVKVNGKVFWQVDGNIYCDHANLWHIYQSRDYVS